MKKDLVRLLIKNCCRGKECNDCPFLDPNFGCYLEDIISILKKNENGDDEK